VLTTKIVYGIGLIWNHMKDVMEMLRRYFKDKAQVKMAYLFGSMASERGGPLSDIDIGVLLDDDLDRVERSKVKLELISELTSLLKSDRIDLVIMNDAPVNLNYEIIKSRKPLIENKSVKVDFEHYILSRYLDRRYYDRRWVSRYIERRDDSHE